MSTSQFKLYDHTTTLNGAVCLNVEFLGRNDKMTFLYGQEDQVWARGTNQTIQAISVAPYISPYDAALSRPGLEIEDAAKGLNIEALGNTTLRITDMAHDPSGHITLLNGQTATEKLYHDDGTKWGEAGTTWGTEVTIHNRHGIGGTITEDFVGVKHVDIAHSSAFA